MALLAFTCGKSNEGPTSPTDPTDPGSGPWAFRASLIDPALIQYITPLGSLNPPSRALPTDHLYFRVADPDKGESPVTLRTAFFAPADGIVADVLRSGTSPDVGLHVRVTTTTRYILGHVIPDIPLNRGTRITAGQRLGTTGSVFDIDLGMINESLALPGFVNPARVGSSLHADAPLRYFDEPLRSQLYAKVRRIGSDLDGKIDFDVPGRLTGNWFTAESVPLVFAYDTWDSERVVIAVSGGLLRNGLYTIGAADPLPRDVSVASGIVRYALTPAASRPGGPPPGSGTSGVPVAQMLVQMLDGQRIKVEMFSASATADGFTGDSREFVR